MIRLGIIGSDGSSFETRYLPLFRKLQSRIQIAVVYDPVRVHAQRVASHFDAKICNSFQQIVERQDIHGIFMLSPVWSKGVTLRGAMLHNKPLYCTRRVWDQLDEKQELEAVYRETGATVVVESEARYWPSILRSRELQATFLGEPQEIAWHFNGKKLHSCGSLKKTLSEILDTSCFLLQRSEIRHQEQYNENCQNSISSLRFLFEKRQSDKGTRSLPVTVFHSDDSSAYLLRICYEQGTVDINSPIELSWQIDGAVHHQLLRGEQSAGERQVDHFCRHIAGGLIPLHNLTNALWNDRHCEWLSELLSQD